jgi:serine/threonine protein kinase/tetratricopeptide (TPR) repeat protein
VLDRWIGSYRLMEKLGAGGMGEVYRAADSRLNRQVALKILSSGNANRLRSLERFRREACAIAALNHPNIVTIYSVEEYESTHFLTMELVQGRTLGNLIPTDGLPLFRVLDIAVPLAEALEAAHERGIVHRDLKPDNVMVSHEGRVKVLDFGIAKSDPDGGATLVAGALPEDPTLTATGLVIGTPSYMSPEQALGRDVDARSDLFSFGVLLFEMATGHRPFQGNTASETVAALLRDDAPRASSLNRGIPAALDDLIASCLEKDPELRMQSARELRQRLQTLAARLSAPSTAPALTLPTNTGRVMQWRRQWRTPAAAFALTGCLALTLTVTSPRLVKLTLPGHSPEQGQALAVLPLGNFSGDPEYFVDGMTEALIASLSDIHGVRVISRQSVMRYKGSSEPLPKIARELGVDIIVQGSVIRDGDRVRITAQLIRADPEQQIWADSYDRDLRDILALQREVARAISAEIQVKLDPEDQQRLAESRPVVPEAYEAYLQGRQAWYQRTAEGFASALRFFQKAIDLDPKFAPAHAGLADAYLMSPFFGFDSPGKAFPEARKHAQAALDLDPKLSDAHVSLGLVYLFVNRQWDKAEASLLRALSLNPSNPAAHYNYTLYLAARGRREESMEQARLLYQLDPLSPMSNLNMAVTAYNHGQKREALQYFHKAEDLSPAFHLSYFRLAGMYRLEGQKELELDTFRKALSVRYPQIVPAMDNGYKTGGNQAALRAAAQALESLSGEQFVLPDDIGRVYDRLDDRDSALDCLEASYRQGLPGALLFEANADWDWYNLRNEPRFRSLVDQIGKTALAPAPASSRPARGCRSTPPAQETTGSQSAR